MKCFKYSFYFFHIMYWNKIKSLSWKECPKTQKELSSAAWLTRALTWGWKASPEWQIQSRALDGPVLYPAVGLISQMFFCSCLFSLVLNLKSFLMNEPIKPILQEGPETNPIAMILSTANELLWFAAAKGQSQRKKPHRLQVTYGYFLFVIIFMSL